MEKTEFEDKYEKLEDLAQAKEKWDRAIVTGGHLGEMKFNIITGDIFKAYNVVKNAINLFNGGREVPVRVVRVEATISRSSDSKDPVESPAQSSLKSRNKSLTDVIVIDDSDQEGEEVGSSNSATSGDQLHLCGIFVNPVELQRCVTEFDRINLQIQRNKANIEKLQLEQQQRVAQQQRIMLEQQQRQLQQLPQRQWIKADDTAL